MMARVETVVHRRQAVAVGDGHWNEGRNMGKVYEEITPTLAEWIGEQQMFFVATAPLAGDGLINCSPKGIDTLRILGPKEVAYLDLTGSGIETAAHLRENGRIVLMFCAFTGPPKIVRLHGVGEALTSETAGFRELRPLFPDVRGARAIVRVRLNRIGDSCGHAVPRYEFLEQRDTLLHWADGKSDAELAEYRQRKNARSLDGLAGLL
jgi:hypothetical protein